MIARDHVRPQQFARLLAGCLLAAATCAAVGQTIEVRPQSIEGGDAATLAWKANGSSVYITGVGRVASSGDTQVHPWSTTTYWLIEDSDGGPLFASTTLAVVGNKEFTLWLPREFAPAKRREASGVRLTVFLDTAARVLEEAWKAQDLQWSRLNEVGDTFLTTLKFELDDPPAADEPHLGMRRVAFCIVVHPPVRGAQSYEIRTRVESRPRYETKFTETERDHALALSLADRLDQQIREALRRKKK